MTYHDWERGTSDMHCCKRCGAVAEQNDTYDGFVYSRPECIDAPNVVPMTLRRAKQIREASAKRASAMTWPITEQFKPTEPA